MVASLSGEIRTISPSALLKMSNEQPQKRRNLKQTVCRKLHGMSANYLTVYSSEYNFRVTGHAQKGLERGCW